VQKSINLRKQQAAATRAALIAVARRLFTERGFHETGISELCATAGVTRGALYHHFGDKEQLFEAVFHEISDDIGLFTGLADDPWQELVDGMQGFLNRVADSDEVQRVLLLDGPVVLGPARWRDIRTIFTTTRLAPTLDRLIRAGIIAPQPTEPLAELLLAVLNDAAMAIAHAEDPAARRRELGAALTTLVSGLRR
jgi:AcrR family transcriptional regulator